MLLGVIGAVLMAAAGVLGSRLLGFQREAVGLGLAPAAGVALLAALSGWGLLLGLPEVATGRALLGICLIGVAVALSDLIRHGGLRCLLSLRLTTTLLLSALVVPIAVLTPAVFVESGVPDYVHDGATHAEIIDALRHGVRLAGYDWYPVGFHAPVAALLATVPPVDSASGAIGWALGLTLLAPLAVFGFGAALWPDLRVAAAGALLLALTSAYPYGAQLYSVWPMAAGVLLVLGLWTTCLKYFASPSFRLAVLGGLLTGALMLTHGTEIYTVAIGLAAFALPARKRLASWRVVRHVGLALGCALVVTIPYLPSLGGWAAAGGAVTVGTDYFDFRHTLNHADALEEALFWASAVSSGYLVDLPARLLLLSLGGWVAFRQGAGRVLVPLIVLFAMLVALSRYVDAVPVRTVFALTLPWAVDDRLVMTLSLLAAPLGGLGLVRLADTLAARARADRTMRSIAFSWKRAARLALVLGLAGGLASVVLVAQKFSLQTGGIVTYAADDALAMAWLRQHAEPGELLMNDGAADAGIWAPYKSNVTIVLPRTRVVSPSGPELLLRANLGQLDTVAAVRDAACKLRVQYVFRGAANSPSEFRQFPELDDLRKSQSLEEVFSSGQAAVFRTQLGCTTP